MRKIITGALVVIGWMWAVAAGAVLPYASDFDICKAIATKAQTGQCHITALSIDQARQILQLFADNDPSTTAKHSRFTSVERAGKVWPGMAELTSKAGTGAAVDGSRGKGTRVMVCVSYDPNGRTVFQNCGPPTD